MTPVHATEHSVSCALMSILTQCLLVFFLCSFFKDNGYW